MRGDILGGKPSRGSSSNFFVSSLSAVVLLFCCLIFGVVLLSFIYCGGEKPEQETAANIAGKIYPEMTYEPIDVVYTWVNGSDPRHIRMVNEAKIRVGLKERNENNETVDAATSNRFQDNNELRYSLRSLEKFAGWVRNVYIVTNGQVPYWLNLDNPRVQVIPHSDIFPNKTHLPTFSSPAIEVHLHKIPGLSKKFLYFNDDVVLGNYIWLSDFYTPATGQSLYLSWDVPNCASGCPPAWVGDGFCDKNCNTKDCDFDGGDCEGKEENDRTDLGNIDYSYFENDEEDFYENFYHSDTCSESCSDFYIGDQYCDRLCNVPQCGYDGGDCGWGNIFQHIYGVDGETLFNKNNDNNNEDKTVQIKVPEKTLALYINFSSVVEETSSIKEGSFDNQEVVRTASISSRYKTLLVTLQRLPESASSKQADFSVVLKQESGEFIEFVFTLISEIYPINEPDNYELLEEKEQDMMPLIQKDNIHDGHNHEETILKGKGEVGGEENKEREEEKEEEEEEEGERVGGRNLLGLEETPSGRNKMSNGQKQMKNKITVVKADFRDGQFTKNYYSPTHSSSSPSPPASPSSSPSSLSSPTTRKLLDIYGDSLKHVNRLLNSQYGRPTDIRKVPAHMPHFVQTEVMEDLQSIFPEEYDATSSHPFRQGDDMQMMFAYKYFLKARWADFDLYEVLRQDVDTNGDGIISSNEMLTLAVMAYGAPLPEDRYSKLLQKFAENKGVIRLDESGNSKKEWEELKEKRGGLAEIADSLSVTYRDVSLLEGVVDFLQEAKKKKPKYKYNIKGTDDVAFLMISEQDKEIVGRLDGIRRDRQKFMCLNDNMDHSNPDSIATKQALSDLYEAIVPLPSSFELPEGVENPTLYIDEIREMKNQQQELSMQYMVCSLIFMFAFLIVLLLLLPKNSKRHLT